jgi:hypothetical protein
MLSEILLTGLIGIIFDPKPIFFFVVVIIQLLMVASSVHHVVVMKLFKGLGVHKTSTTATSPSCAG